MRHRVLSRSVAPVAAISLLVALAGCSTLSPSKDVALYSGPALSESQVATIVTTEDVQLLALDGEEVGGGLLGAREARYALKPGERVLSLRYHGFFRTDAENHDVIRSRPLAVRFIARAGETYHVEFPVPKTVEAARVFAKSPELTLVSSRGERHQAQLIRSVAEASLLDTISRAFQTEETQQAVRATAPVEAPVAGTATRPALAPTSSVHYDLLRDIWLRASPEERVRFQQWTLKPEAGGK